MKKGRQRFEPDPDHIPGIYNYCDRWCERCPFTKRCAAFADEQAPYEAEPDDAANAVFWQDMTASSEAARSFLDDAADDDVDVDEDDRARWEADARAMDEAVRAHPLHTARTCPGIRTAPPRWP